jgi:hypothetical protein
MQYYPKSQIKTNLYTNGNELILSTTNNAYQGYYYEISNGKKYTGKTPKDGPNILLSPQQSNLIIENPPSTSPPEIFPIQIPEYIIQNTPTVRSIPLFNPTLPTDQDKQNGQFNRYFCKKTNELKYLEIDKETYTKLQAKDSKIAWDLYEPASLLWVIKGTQENVFNTNKASVFKIEQNQRWNGFSQYFKENYSKYYESSTVSNLYTAGGEFTTKNGQNYIGFYHIHDGTTPMVGKTHINTPHDVLTPIKKSPPITQTTSSVMLPTTPTTSGGGGSYGGGGGSY